MSELHNQAVDILRRLREQDKSGCGFAALAPLLEAYGIKHNDRVLRVDLKVEMGALPQAIIESRSSN